MNLPWISVNSKLQNGLNLLHSVSTPHFISVLECVLKSQNDDDSLFEEVKKLQESLNLSPYDFQLLVQSIAYIFKQSSKVLMKPTDLQKQLSNVLKFDSEKTEEFVKVWSNQTKADFANLESRQKLENIAWELNLQSASALNLKEANPKVRIHLGLSDMQNDATNNINFELDSDQLVELYNTLEDIQIKLDNIKKIEM